MLRSPIPDSWVGSSLLNLHSRTLDWRDESKGWDWRFITLAVLISLDSSELCRQRLVALEVHELTSYERDLESTESLLERLVCVSWRNPSWSISVVVPSAPDQWHSLISGPWCPSLIEAIRVLWIGVWDQLQPNRSNSKWCVSDFYSPPFGLLLTAADAEPEAICKPAVDPWGIGLDVFCLKESIESFMKPFWLLTGVFPDEIEARLRFKSKPSWKSMDLTQVGSLCRFELELDGLFPFLWFSFSISWFPPRLLGLGFGLCWILSVIS